jgi:hypothetical protein
VVKASDMMIARRADTQARADVATWKMMAKLNGTGSLPAEAQAYLASYQALLKAGTEAEATDATIRQVYQTYYAAMGGVGTAPDVQGRPVDPVPDNVTPFKRPKPQRAKAPPTKSGPSALGGSGTDGKPRVPAALIFAGLVIIVVGLKYYFR